MAHLKKTDLSVTFLLNVMLNILKEMFESKSCVEVCWSAVVLSNVLRHSGV